MDVAVTHDKDVSLLLDMSYNVFLSLSVAECSLAELIGFHFLSPKHNHNTFSPAHIHETKQKM